MERIQITVPEQPPVGSVVLAAGGIAWQRSSGFSHWYPANGSEIGLPWSRLVVDCGPLDLVHRAEPTT